MLSYNVVRQLCECDTLRGAIILVAAFLIFLVLTLGYSKFPPGRTIYDATAGVETDYEVLGLPATLLVTAVFNGVIYGVIVWLIYTLVESARKGRQKEPATTT